MYLTFSFFLFILFYAQLLVKLLRPQTGELAAPSAPRVKAWVKARTEVGYDKPTRNAMDFRASNTPRRCDCDAIDAEIEMAVS